MSEEKVKSSGKRSKPVPVMVTMVEQHGLSAVVTYRDDKDKVHACIIDSKYAASPKPGAVFGVPKVAISRSTPYGIDWSLVYPKGIMISAEEMQEVMYSHGIYTLDDLVKNTPTLIQSINNILRFNTANIVRDIRRAIGG